MSNTFVRSIGTIVGLMMAIESAAAENESWWQFLGPKGNGHAVAREIPTHWSDTENIAWKTPIHDRGWSSPVIHGDQIWVTTATVDGHKLYAVCVDKNTGEIRHDVQVFDVESPQPITSANTYATPTPVIEQGRVFVHFGTYGTACLDSSTGKVLWSRRDLNCDHERNAGPASSPTIINGNLVVHVDGRDVQYIVALDRDTGQTRWKTARSYDYSAVPVHHRKAYSMPGIAPRGDGIQIVSAAAQGVYAYDENGTEIWRSRHKGWSVAPRPVAGHGLVFVLVDRDHPELWAIRHDGRGDITDTHVAWRETRGMPQRCTPILVGDLLFTMSRDGILTCLEAQTGNQIWKRRLEGRYSATPLYAAGRLYWFNEDAECTIHRPGRTWEQIAGNSLAPQSLLASPAVDGNALFVRTERFLYRIENGKQRATDTRHDTSPFVGRWNIGLPKNGGKPAFVMTLNSDGSAAKSHVPSSTGSWQEVAGEARVVWSDGWRDILRPKRDGFRKIAFGPGRDFDSQPSNTDTADKRSD